MVKRRPTIADVASAADVSVGTVSNYLNGTANVRKETAQRIDAAVRDLAYRPSVVARALSHANSAHSIHDRSHSPRLVVAGYISVDYLCRVDVLPHRDDRITAQHIEKALGGPAANVAVAAAGIGMSGRYGLDVELATALGSDPDSEWALAELSRKGVHALPIRQPFNNRLSRCIVFIEENGSRTIVNEPFELSEVDLTSQLNVKPEARSCCLHIEGYHYDRMRGSIDRFHDAGWKVSMHSAGLPASSRTPDAFLDLVSRLDLAFAGDRLIREIFDIRLPTTSALIADIATKLSDLERRGHLVITLGPLGAVVFPADNSAPIEVPALPVKLVDTTGAGDSFAGAFLAYWMNGDSLQSAAGHAAASGSLTTTVEGAQGMISSHEDLSAALAGRGWLEAS
ncbi:MAG: LacI family DNA-binding transcriptional regulator [Mesorhizobium sp.]|nr:PfkB family carbohydrate kinase [Mesorhizobium sp.]MBL8579856.1 LacI family DNA-binding transcriptional regulator [Mesorhizobium sp.]